MAANPDTLKVGRVVMAEWRSIVKDRRLFGILFLIPLLYTAMFGYIYINHKVKEIDTVLFDGDQSQLSRQIAQAFDTSESFRIVRLARSEAEVNEALASGEAKVGVVIPGSFEARLKHGDTLPVLTLVDGSNMMISNAATKGANEVISTFGMGVSAKKLQQQGLQDEQIGSTFSAIPFRYRVLYNPTFNYSDFMVYGLVGAILQQVLLLGIALAVTREKELRTWDRYAAWKREPWRLAYAKSAPYFLIGMFNAVAALLLVVDAYGLPLQGSALHAVLLSACFTFAVVGIGYLVSLFSGSQLASTQTAMLIAVPSFLLSGYTWPFEAMPAGLKIAGHLLPLTYYLDGVRHALVKGNGWDSIWRDCVALVVTGLAAYLAALLLTRFALFRKPPAEAPSALPAMQNFTQTCKEAHTP